MREAVYRLRYSVWVAEMTHAQPIHFPDGKIKDEFDDQAIHAAAISDGWPVAAVRLVTPSEQGLPIRRVVPLRLGGASDSMGEIGYLVLDHRVRRRREDGPFGAEPYLRKSEGGVLPDGGPLAIPLQGRKGPRVILGLFRSLYQASKRIRLGRWLFMADMRVFTLLNRYGFPFRQVADRLPEFPDRVPCLMSLTEFEDQLRRLDPAFFEEFTVDIDDSPRFSS